MIMGHFATALIPFARLRKTEKAPFWVLLLAAQFLDLLMVAFVILGLESFTPHDFLDLSFRNMRTEMPLSHDILPVLGWSLAFAGAIYAFTKNGALTLWSLILIWFHEVSDLLVGFYHFVLGKDTLRLGLNLYNEAPVTGLLIEALLCGICIWLFASISARNGQKVTHKTLAWLAVILIGGTFATLPIANQSINALIN